MDIAGSNLSASGDDDNDVINQLENQLAAAKSYIATLEFHNARMDRENRMLKINLEDAKLEIVERDTQIDIMRANITQMMLQASARIAA